MLKRLSRSQKFDVGLEKSVNFIILTFPLTLEGLYIQKGDNMGRYILERMGYMIITFFIIMTISFVAMKLLPGTPFKNQDKMTEQQLEIIKEHYRLDDPIPVQYVHYIWDFLHGDLGQSFQFMNQGVTDILVEKMGPSLTLGAEALVIGMILGLLLGVIAAIRHNTFLDYGSTTLAVIGISVQIGRAHV